MPGPLTPDVPIAPGVPSVLRDATNSAPGDTGRLTGDAISVTASKKDQWGLYRASDNSLAVSADTVNSIGYDAEYRIADYPLQDGQFESYDKVALPFAVRVQLIKGGRFDERREFLRILDTLRGDTELYNVVTPEWSHLNVNIERVSIDRSREQGANLITAELILREIRVDATATTSNSKEPSAASPVSAGTVQPDPPSADLKAITDAKPIKPFAGDIETVQNIPLIPNTPAQSLPPLVPQFRTIDEARTALGMEGQPAARVHRMSPGATRAKERSRFFPGIAAAMAAQWGPLLTAQEAQAA